MCRENDQNLKFFDNLSAIVNELQVEVTEI